MNYLKQKFEEYNITITKLSKRTGIARETLSDYINGKRRINKLDHIWLIATVLEFNYIEFNEFLKDNLPRKVDKNVN